jgi:hypothetical protein
MACAQWQHQPSEDSQYRYFVQLMGEPEANLLSYRASGNQIFLYSCLWACHIILDIAKKTGENDRNRADGNE